MLCVSHQVAQAFFENPELIIIRAKSSRMLMFTPNWLIRNRCEELYIFKVVPFEKQVISFCYRTVGLMGGRLTARGRKMIKPKVNYWGYLGKVRSK